MSLKKIYQSGALFLPLLLLLSRAANAGNPFNPAFDPLNPSLTGTAGRRTPIVTAIEKARPAIVSVYAQVLVQRGSPFPRSPFHDEFFDHFFSDMWAPQARQGTTLGSGVIIDGARGLIVTNEHVVRGAAQIKITMSDSRELAATVLGADPRYDLAMLQVKTKKNLPQLVLGDSSNLMIGETVIAIGNPFGLTHTATTGVVSAVGRTVPGVGRNESLKDLIQTDASINPGNSGGPLLNINGEIIGINTAILERGEGLGFAIPSDKVRRIAARLLRGNSGADLDLGLELVEPGHPDQGEPACLITALENGGPAAASGLKKGDLLLSLDGSPTATLADYEMILSSLKPGQRVTAEVNRNNQSLRLTLTPRQFTEAEALKLASHVYGIKTREIQGRLSLESPPDHSPAAGLGLHEGDFLLTFGGRDLTNQSDLARAVLESRFQNTVLIAIQRGHIVYQITLTRVTNG
ncbi:MAG: trypsin-like peptidase domain-containing protein [Candidatus Adiutrix intracellularis]|jgi:S1-C subfamily serine protease|nr:trypsin-like peptidase domain-containing protein [Candidatus Adiutrix intracellularis]